MLIVSLSSLRFPYRFSLCFRERVRKNISSNTMPIVAEYAKSNRSSCKSCSQTIASKALRVGLISKGPGGFDMTRWHHLDCFPTDSESIASVDDIKGLAALQKDDQEALAKLVEQSGEPAKKVDGKEAEISGKKVKEAKGSSASSGVIAEYAKSGRSACKKCSQPIGSKTLRVGVMGKGPGGVDMAAWHHLDCFPTDSVSIASVDDIKGFAALEKDDQDALAKLVEQCGDPAKEADGKEAEITHPASAGISGKKVKETKGSSVSSEVIAEYAKSGRSSCKKCSQPIGSKTLRVGLMGKGPGGVDMARWHHVDCFPTDSESIASVDDIKGYADLEKDDQEALAKLVEQCGKPAKIVHEKDVEMKHPASVEISEKKIKVTKGSSSSKVIAEYAKSNRSSCKQCSQTIATKKLRLGLVTRDFRGFDTTKWYHLGCFPVESDPVESVEDIGGFSSLQNGDQDALKKLIQQCEEMLKMNEDVAESGTDNQLTEETNKRKHSEVGEMVEEDEPQTSANEQTTRKPKMDISESISRVEADITLSASDVKDKYRDASLLPKWKAFETVIFLERDDGLNDSEKIAAFDFDGCLAKTSVKVTGADAWSLMYPSIPEKLQSLYSQGYKLVIYTNESNIDRWKNKRQVAVDSKIGRLNSFIKRVGVPIQVFIACGVASSGDKDDRYRKPKSGMWQLMKKHFNSGIAIDMDRSFYVGDAAGRKGDHSDADIKFAQASGLKFYTPEEYFIS